MAYKKTLADNHLSQYGRSHPMGGPRDTEIRRVDGMPAHVNDLEAGWIDMYGSQGESMAKAVGAGSINPKTGLKEYPLPWLAIGAGAAVGSAILGGLQAWSGGKASTQQAKSQKKLKQLEIDEANEALGELDLTKESKEQVAQAEFSHEAEGFGMQKEDATQQLNTAIQKSGLVTSSGVTQKRSSLWKRFEHAEKGLLGQLGKAMGGIEEWYEGEKSRLSGVIERARLQKKAFQKQADAGIFG